MLLFILLISFVAIVLTFLLVWVPIRDAVKLANEQAEKQVSKDLDAMFVFLPVDYLPYIKLGCMLLLGLILYVITYMATPPAPYVAAGLGAVLGYFVPEIFVHRMKRKRIAKFSNQLVDGLVLLSNGLRAGFSLQQALEMLVEESDPPISQEFALVLRQYQLGMDIDDALLRCVTRTEDEDLGLAVTAVMITRQVGGNLAEIFDRIVSMIRDRKLLQGKVQALTAQGKLQAVVVALIPYILGAIVMKVNPELMQVMWSTVPGIIALSIVIVLDTIGYLWVVKLTRIEY
jgi:tight adherence protein B